MDISVIHNCEGDLEKFDLLLINLVEFVSGKHLTDRERIFLLKLMEIDKRGDNPFHRSSSSEIASSFRFKGAASRIWKFKRSLKNKGYVNNELSGFSNEFRMLIDSSKVGLKLVINKYGKD